MLISILRILVFLCLFTSPWQALAQIKAVNTPEGVLKTAPGHGDNCYQCTGLFLSGKQLMYDAFINIEAIFPNEGPIKLVSVNVSSGGNCCPPTNYILDFSRKPHRVVKDHGFGKDISRSENGVVFTETKSENQLGDPMLQVFGYEFGTGRVKQMKAVPQYTTAPLSAKEYPWDVLGDPTLRAPLLALMGQAAFLDLRHRTTIASKEELIISEDKLIFGSGCFPHGCGGARGAFVIDIKRNLAWAATKDEDRAVIWGVLKKGGDRVSRFFVKWLSDNQVPLQNVSFAAISPALRNSYSNSYLPKTPNFDTGGRVQLASNVTPSTQPISTVKLFKVLSPSIYVVRTTTDAGDTLQGSAVAVSKDSLLTNCHVLKDATTIELLQTGTTQKAILASADFDRERCVLKTDGVLNSYVAIRPYEDLNFGEHVFTIGAPAGLELTLADGLISGKRSDQGSHLVQTTAPISPGSSGGGLFDEYGNLIGITTFLLKNTENLNFAISAEDYLRR